jgi:outer membrane lipase/esterase
MTDAAGGLHRRRRGLGTLGLIGAALVVVAPAAGSESSWHIAVFGDSHSDTGNWLKPDVPWRTPGYAEGRFTNGPVWVEQLAAALSADVPRPSKLWGSNFAWGGARTGVGFDGGGSNLIPRLETQTEQFLARGGDVANTLAVVFIGHNDFGYFAGSDPVGPADSVARAVAALAAGGVKHFVAPTLHPLGELPSYRGGTRAATLNLLTDQFNALVDARLDALAREWQIAVYRPDFFALANGAEPPDAGWQGMDFLTPAREGATIVADPERHVYWDVNHFSASFHDILAQESLRTIFRERDGDLDANQLTDGLDLLAWQRSAADDRWLGPWEGRFGGVDRGAVATPLPEPAAAIACVTWACVGASCGRFRRQRTFDHRRQAGRRQ